MPDKRADPLADALDRLYSAPFDAFLATRKELVTTLKQGGHGDAARAVAASPKPTRTAWALGQVARRRPELVQAMLDARDAAASVQKGADADELRGALRDHRARVTDVLHEARDVLAAAGFDASAGQVRRMGETLQAACAPGSEARARLVAGTLAHDVAVDDPFAGIEAGPARPRGEHAQPRAKDAEKEPAAARDGDGARERLRKEQAAAAEAARRRVEALEEEAREARATARAAEAAASRAQADADRARRAVDDVESRLRRAREEQRASRA
jgi:hypothetical protein